MGPEYLFSSSMLVLTAIVLAAQRILNQSLQGERTAAKSHTPALKPAELAFLARPGDLSHPAIVLAFDLLHRAVKARSANAPLDLAPYEKRLWAQAIDFAKTRAKDELEKALPKPTIRNIPIIVNRLDRIYRFITKQLRALLKQILSDPRKIKSYISFGGVTRFAADFLSVNYQQALHEEMSGHLLSEGLLLARQTRIKHGQQLACYAALASVLAVAAALISIGFLPGLSAILLGAGGALVVTLVFRAREFVPAYSEFRDVFAHLQRKGWRMTLFRALVELISLAGWTSAYLTLAIVTAVDLLIVHWLLKVPFLEALSMILAATILFLVIIRLLCQSYSYLHSDQPSAGGRRYLDKVKSRLSRQSPLESFKSVLESGEYNPEFSEILALYGIETLFFLA